jgi:hypothetical protein
LRGSDPIDFDEAADTAAWNPMSESATGALTDAATSIPWRAVAAMLPPDRRRWYPVAEAGGS